MNYEDFVCCIQTKMKEKLGNEVQVELHRIVKNNSVVLDGLSICEKGKGVAPTIYLNEFYEKYQEGVTIPEILEYMESVYDRNRLEEPFLTDFYMDYEKVKDHLACKLISRERNRELLTQVPYVPFLDLAVVCYYRLENQEMGNGSILVFESHREKWGVSREELLWTARQNTLRILPPSFIDLNEILGLGETVLKEQGNTLGERKDPEKEEKIPMYILTNQENYLGAVNMIYDSVLEDAGRKLQSDFWLLPSSIHECILVPASVSMTKEELEAMVHHVNENEVMKEEYLSDSVYFYQRILHKLERK